MEGSDDETAGSSRNERTPLTERGWLGGKSSSFCSAVHIGSRSVGSPLVKFNLLRRGQEFRCKVCNLHLDSKTVLEEDRTATVQKL